MDKVTKICIALITIMILTCIFIINVMTKANCDWLDISAKMTIYTFVELFIATIIIGKIESKEA